MDNNEQKATNRLLDKIASLSQPQLARATNALIMIWNVTEQEAEEAVTAESDDEELEEPVL